MAVTPDASRAWDFLPWISLGIGLAYYTAISVFLRLRLGRAVGVTRYEPPRGISPAMAACLMENGRAERAFASAIVSLAARKLIRIRESGDLFELEKLRHPEEPIPFEETVVLDGFFRNKPDSCPFNAVESGLLFSVFADFSTALESQANPRLLSSHAVFWFLGLYPSFYAVWFALPTISSSQRHSWSLGDLYLVIWILLGGFCLMGALRMWPSTIRKLGSWIPGVKRSRRPFTWSDLTPVYLTVSALIGFGILAYLTSREFAAVLAAVLLMDSVFRHLLEAPTREGRRVMSELANFKEFLSRADADRLDRENRAGRTPRVIEPYSAYAIALGVEQAWGEEFVDNLLTFIHWNQAYRFHLGTTAIPSSDGFERGPIELRLRDR